ncbi:MAG: hypothetical protein N4A53_11990, partial [Pelagimonas sp.]|nr:hypothetical protein [Pelagimonas sp.]
MSVSLPNSTELDRLLVLGHFSLDSYSGTPGSARGADVSPVDGWSVLITSEEISGLEGDPEFEKSVATFQATAYINDTTGEVVVAYRGTDDNGELAETSIPLGAGYDGSNLPVETLSYLQDAYNFLTNVYDRVDVFDKDLITLTGHSLGGIAAGALGAITHIDAVTFDSGPHSEVIQHLEPLLELRSLDDLLTPDESKVKNLRVTGEALQAAIDAATAGGSVLADFIDVLNRIGIYGAGLSSALAGLADAERVGVIYEELNAGGHFIPGSDAIQLHSMALAQILLLGNEKLGLTNFNGVSGFLKGFFDAELAAQAGYDANGEREESDVRLFEAVVKSYLDANIDVVSPLLQAVDGILHLATDADFGALETTEILSANYQAPVARISELLIHYAGQQLRKNAAFDSSVLQADASQNFLTFDLTKLDFAPSEAEAIPLGLERLWGHINWAAQVDALFEGAFLSSDAVTVFSGTGDQGATYTSSVPGGEAIIGGAGDDVITVQTGNNFVFANNGNDTVYGGSEGDVLIGGKGNDFLLGGDGDDILIAGSGLDVLEGGNGDDTLIGGGSRSHTSDELSGGAGTDTAVFLGLEAMYNVVQQADGSHLVSRAGLPGSGQTLVAADVESIAFDNSSCFSAGSEVKLWDGGSKPIELITQSDVVLTFDADGNPVPGVVDKLFTNSTQEFITLDFADGREKLTVTPGHRFVTETGDYMEIGHLLRLGAGSARV